MAFVTYLPPCQLYDAILVVVDRLTKLRHYIHCQTTDSAEEIARLFTENTFRLHGRPIDIVSDRNAKFKSDFWKPLPTRCSLTPLRSPRSLQPMDTSLGWESSPTSLRLCLQGFASDMQLTLEHLKTELP